jgi:hypothetical protein
VLAILSPEVGFIELEQAYAQADGGTSTGGDSAAAAAAGEDAAAAPP